MHWLDWSIVIGLMVLLCVMAFRTRRLTRSVSDFLAANRTAGRYLIGVSEGMAGLGAISVVAMFEMHYQAGFTPIWWEMILLPMTLIIAMTGWVVYRFRETRALTLAQFFEARYSRNFRVFAGLLAFLSGVINFGIFPSVGARFLIYYCGLPQQFEVVWVWVPTFPLVMAILLSIALTFTLIGGQVAVMVTDFIQGVFANVVFVLVAGFIMLAFGWDDIAQTVTAAPPDQSLIDPQQTAGIRNYSTTYFLIAIFGMWYFTLAWQGTQGYTCSALSAHEAKMARVIALYRLFPQKIAIWIIPIAALVVMRHPDYANLAAQIGEALSGTGNDQITMQMTVPVATRSFLPIGLLGAFAAVMLGAFISTHDSYMHAWGSVFIQDCVLPFRKKPLSPQAHLRWLRWSIVGVTIFIFFFSLLFRHTQDVLMFFAITGTIFIGGAGSAIIGGLYWKRGTTTGAWSALIVGAVVSVFGVMAPQLNKDFPLTGQEMMFIACLAAIAAYIFVSLLLPGEAPDMDRILKRGRHAHPEEHGDDDPAKTASLIPGVTADSEFTPTDRLLFWGSGVYIVTLVILFLGGTLINLIWGISEEVWLRFWHVFIWVYLVLGVLVTIWLTIGGFFDLSRMYRLLRTEVIDPTDDGTVSKPPAEAPPPAP